MEDFDVIVIGFGFAGAVSAIAAHDAGARVLLLEKRNSAGGISICSVGGLRCSDSADAALSYLRATNGGTTPDDVLAVLAHGMVALPTFVKKLADTAGATLTSRKALGNYPFPGHGSFSFVNVESVAGFDPAGEFPAVRGAPAGMRLFKVVAENVRQRGIAVRYGTPAERLLIEQGRVVGVEVNGQPIYARRGVVLTTGGFEGAPELQRQYWPMAPVLSAASRTNTGDGLRMAQAAGSALWHMWHYHGSYGFRHPDPDYPFGVRLKRLPDWTPGAEIRHDVTMSWILVDKSGRRFMNEYEPYTQDTGHRALEPIDFSTQDRPRLPALLIVDADGRERFPLSAPTWNDDEVAARYAHQTPHMMDEAILTRFETLSDLARHFHLDPATLEATVAEWNALVENGAPDRLGRPAFGRAVLRKPPYSAAQIWPIVSNTQGGPAHDARQRVLDAFGEPIPGLYEAGEIGSVFGSIYMSGGNLAECFVGGQVAGSEAAAGDKHDAATVARLPMHALRNLHGTSVDPSNCH